MKRRSGQRSAPYLFVAPATLLFGLFFALPIGYAAYLSFRKVKISGLGLGNAVVAAEVLCDLMAVAGVQDVRNLHLRRYPPAFGATVFGDRERFRAAVIEGDLAGNLPLAPHEIASFRFDSELIDLQVSDR